MNTTDLNKTEPWQLTKYAGVNVWWAAAFTAFAFVSAEANAIWPLLHSQVDGHPLNRFGVLKAASMLLMLFIIAANTLLSIRRIVLFASDDPAILRAIEFYSLVFMGCVFAAFALIL